MRGNIDYKKITRLLKSGDFFVSLIFDSFIK